MIWSWPGQFRAGAAVDRVTSLLDVGPTLLDLAGAPMKNVAGRSLSRFLSGHGDVQGWPDDALPECCGHRGAHPSRMLREGPWKLVFDIEHDAPAALYHLADDLTEQKNLIGEAAQQDRVARMEMLYREIRGSKRSTPVPGE